MTETNPLLTRSYADAVVTSRFQDLFGRAPAQAGLDYWGNWLTQDAKNYDGLSQTLLNGASEEDLAYYNNRRNNTPDQTTDPVETTPARTVAPTTLPTTLAEVEPVVAPKQYAPRGSDLVEGRMNGLLASNSAYMQAARKAGERTAHSRGLLNSSLAGGAAQKAAIESALPIAQQDSQSIINANMAGYQGDIDSFLIGRQSEESSKLSAQDFMQDSALSAQNAKQDFVSNSKLSAQDAAQQIELDRIQQAGANYRQAVEMEWNHQMAIMELESNERSAIADAMTKLGDNFQAKLAGIQVDADLTAAAKTSAIRDLQDAYQANIASIGAIYGVAISWTGLDFETTEDPAPTPTTDTEDEYDGYQNRAGDA